MNIPPSALPVDQMFRDFRALQGALPTESVSDHIALDNHFRKILLLASASHLEELMTFHLREHVATLGEANYEFVRKFAIERMFSRWFDFDQAKPTFFFKMFGTKCKTTYEEVLAESPEFEKSSIGFMILCSTRNNLVHNNLASYTFDLTVDEIDAHFRAATEFPPAALRIVTSTQ